MDDINDEALERLAEHWRRNDEPPNPHQYDAIIILTESDGPHGPFEVYGAVKWDPVRRRYEVEPVVEGEAGVYHEAELQLSPERFHQAKHVLRQMGIKHLVRIFDRTKVRRERPTTLPNSLFPTEIKT